MSVVVGLYFPTGAAMRRHVLSTLEGLDLHVREVAEAAARRSGLSLEEWVAAALAEETDPGPKPPLPSRAGEDFDSIVARIAKTATARKAPKGDYETLMSAVAAQHERRAQDQASRTAIALESMASWIEHAEERLNETARASAHHQDRMASALSDALSALKGRLDTVERHVVSERPAPARIEFPVQDAIKALEPLSETLVGLRTDMSRLAERLEQPANPAVEAIRTEIERLRSSMAGLATRDEIATLDHALRDVTKDLDQGRSSKDLLTLAHSIAAIYQQVQGLSDELAEGLHRRIGAEIDAIKRKIDGVAETGVDRSVIDFLSSQIVDMRHDLSRRAEPQQIERLTGDVASLSRQLADLRAHQVGRSDFAALKSSLENVCSALTRTVAAQEANDVPGHLQDLSRRLDILASRPEPEPANLEPIAEQLALLTERMATLTDSRFAQHDTLTAMITRLSSQVQAVADTPPPSHEPLLTRFDRLEDELRQVGRQADTSSVELMLRSISARLEETPSPASAFDALERRIVALSERFDRTPADPLHQVVAEAASHLQKLRSETQAIAEQAAKAALRDVQPSAPAIGDLDALKQGFVELKALQTRSDKKTQQTLRAVHDALETLVSRFPDQGPMTRGAGSPTQSADDMAPADRLEAAVRRLHAAALSQMEEVSAASPEPVLTQESERLDVAADTPRGAGTAFSSHATDLGQVRASFIAAARRAAQTAPQEKSATESLPEPHSDVQAEDADATALEMAALSAPSLIERIRRSFDNHRRPLLFGLAFLILAAGTAQILSGGQPSQHTVIATGPKGVTRVAAYETASRLEQVGASALSAAAEPEQFGLFQRSSLTTASLAAPKFPVDPDTVGEIPPLLPAALRQAALSGDAAAISEVAARAVEGRGLQKDLTLAARLYERAAQVGFAPAQERLAMLHEKGLGVAKDTKLAAIWYERAALGGNARAMHNLATLLASGINGKPDYSSALRWYAEAAEAGVRDSQFNMGVLFARGIGTRADPAKAFKWFALAAMQGDPDAAKKRDDVAARLSAAELSGTKALVEQWRPRGIDPAANEVPSTTEGQTAHLNRIFASRS
ncbi:tetratricopeptide repeat protein [Microvirga alba]|uniref:SEL1-like repeat protein n=1 Tax=Microvirga alba TaxID=2791025 RepID=A0A931BPH8_9HYPH|nr:tetratricopeptide repeat protein [Microvirga alba]MBF9235066.1 SEL1-like repeat protein [Microvirga alba]